MIENLGQYKILELAGPEPLGDVYRARDTRVGRTVTVTVVADAVVDGSGTARACSCGRPRRCRRLAPEHRDAVRSRRRRRAALYLVHEFVQGETLKNVIGGRPLNPRRAVDLASQIAEALADAHAADLVHGASPPRRIVVTPKGHAKIAGFGLAGWIGDGEAGAAGYAAGEDAGFAQTCRRSA